MTELAELVARLRGAEQRIAALMSERANLIATKAEQLAALTKRATAAESSAITAEAEVERLERESAQNAIANSRLAEQMERTLAELEKVREALKQIADWRKRPWTDMMDDAETQSADRAHALEMACAFARRALSEPDKEGMR